MGLRFPVSSILSSIIFLILICLTGAKFCKTVCADEPCKVNGLPGRGTYLRKCKSVLNAFRNGSPLSVIGYYFFEPIVCCPFDRPSRIAAESPSITTTTTTTPQPSSTTTTTTTPQPSSTTTITTTPQPSSTTTTTTTPQPSSTTTITTTAQPSSTTTTTTTPQPSSTTTTTTTPQPSSTTTITTTAQPSSTTTITTTPQPSSTTTTPQPSSTTTTTTTPQTSSTITTTTTTESPLTTTTTRESSDPKTIVEEKCKIYNDNRISKSGEKIVGGNKANATLHNVAIYTNDSTAFENFACGGTLISERYVLTAAHCTYSINSGSTNWIRAGVVNINGTGGQSIKIIQRKIHPCYKRRYDLQHDIALLELEKNVTFDEHVQPACLPYTSLNFTEAKASGWGCHEFADDPSPDLYEVTLPIQKCESEAKWKFCAGDNEKDTCQGDSGGSVAVSDEKYESVYTLVGATSGGYSTGGTYMNVFYYVPWIQRIVWPTGDYNQTEICSDP